MGINRNVGARGPRTSTEDRFWAKVSHGVRPSPDVCWIWTGAHTRLGYGNFWDGTYTASGRPRMVEAHRWAFSHFVEDPGNLHVLHSCDVRDCVNYLRCLSKGTRVDNMRDRDSRGRGVVPDLRGFVRGRGQRFTAEEVRSMRENFTGRRGEVGELARLHGVRHQTISGILRGKTWVE